jgi:hypothetical protein
LLGAGQVGFWEFGGVGQLGEGWGKRGQFTSNLRGRWTIPITTGGCQVSGREYKGGTQRGARGQQQGAGKASGSAPCMCHVYMQSYCMCNGMIEC